jgi:hypothetical protein
MPGIWGGRRDAGSTVTSNQCQKMVAMKIELREMGIEDYEAVDALWQEKMG